MENAKKIKILYVITKSNWGGAQRYVYDLVSRLPTDRFEPVVLLGGDGILTKRLTERGIRIIQLPYLQRDVHFFRDIHTLFSFFLIFWKERPDIVHLNSSKAGGIGAFAARLSPIKKIIFTSHGWAFNEDRNIISRLIVRFLSWITVLFSHKTIAVSVATKEAILGLPFVSKSIEVIYLGIDTIQFKDKEVAREIILGPRLSKIPPDAFWIGTISELHPNKGVRYAIEAIKNLRRFTHKPFVFVVIGDGEEKWTLQNTVEHERLEGVVFLVGFREHASSLLKAFDVFSLTSTTESLGYVLLEAGLAKLPVVGTRVGGIPEIVIDGKTGLLVQPRNPIAIRESLHTYIDKPELRALLGEGLENYVKDRFSINRMCEKTYELYEKLL